MSNVFKNQGYFNLLLDTDIDLSSATVTRILYKNPRGASGYFTATVTATTKLSYQFTNADFAYSGEWQFQAYVEIGGLKAYGDIVYQTISNPLG
jgi:hypothetical protein